MCLQTQFLLFGKMKANVLVLFVFCSTLFLYALHRIIGLQKVKPFQDKGRYLVISTFKNHIVIYAALAASGAFISFWRLNFSVQVALIIPAILSLGYVIPILTGKRRLRDLHFIKIFLIAIVWASITVLLPVLEADAAMDKTVLWLFLERSLFVFAITLPFDIRDLKIDAHTAVKTLPSELGIARTKGLAYAALILVIIFASLNVGIYSMRGLIAIGLSAVSTVFLIAYSDRVEHDYYFTGLIDGTMIVQFLLLLGLSSLIP